MAYLGQGKLGKWLESHYFPIKKYPGRISVMFEWIQNNLSPGSVVLECGAGRGQVSYSLGNNVNKVVGIDLIDKVLENPNLDEAHVCDAVNTPFGDNVFDSIFSIMVLEHIKNPRVFLQEMYRILKPGGSFYFITPNSYHYFVQISRIVNERIARIIQKKRGLLEEDHFPTFYHLNSPKLIRRLGAELGFNSVELRFYEGADVVTYFPTLLKPIAIIYAKLVNHIPFLYIFKAIIIGKLTK